MLLTSHPETESNGQRFILLSVQLDNEYPKLIATVVRKAVSKSQVVNDFRYDEINASGYRRASWSSGNKNALCVENLQLRAQISKNDADPKPYGNSMVFNDCYFVEKRDAEAMANTFKKVDAYLAKLEQKFGYLSNYDFAQYVLRVAQALGITEFLCLKRDRRTNAAISLSNEADYMRFGPTSVSSIVDELTDLAIKR